MKNKNQQLLELSKKILLIIIDLKKVLIIQLEKT